MVSWWPALDLRTLIIVRLPLHPFLFWLILASPCAVWLTLWAVARFGRVALKRLTPWLKGSLLLLMPPYLILDAVAEHKLLRFGVGVALYTFWIALIWIQRHSKFETLRAPATKWYARFKSAEFSIPTTVRIVVQDVNSVSPWYIDKLGLKRLAKNPWGEGVATYRFKEDGNSIILTTKRGFWAGKTPILFTKKIRKMRDVLEARGVESLGSIERDRQGTAYFDIHDPEGNTIEVVEER